MVLTKKQKIAALSVGSNTVLIILKTVTGVLSGSVSIISEAIHSSMDLLAAVIAYLSVSLSGKPADDDHPYGHGKIENISGVVEGVLIFIAAALIIKEAAEKMVHPAPLTETGLGIAVMTVSALVNTVVSHFLYQTAREEDSVALEADALHLKTDIYTSLGVAGGLIAIRLTGIYILDPIVAMLVAFLIVKEAWHLCWAAFRPLMDARLDYGEERPIREILARYEAAENIEINYFKTRKSGAQRFADFHLCLPPHMTIREGQEISDEIKKSLYQVSPDVHVHINIEMSRKEQDLRRPAKI